jgi:predicted dehydrogenase
LDGDEMNVGIVGCGIIGQKRADSLGNNKLVAVADIRLEKAIDVATKYENIKVFSDYRDLVNLKEVEVVIISTINNVLAEIALCAVNSGKHVLIEKPGATHYTELEPIITVARKNKVFVKIGYNLRFHSAINKAILMAHTLGDIMYIKINYGHGGRKGYDKEWRADPQISGGGEMIDQGCHTLDLAQCFLGDLILKSSSIKTYFWDMSVEDNAFITLENYNGKTAFIHVSCTEWRNTFSLELYGKTGKLKVEGLGGSYGTEKLTYYKMSLEMGIPEITTWEFAKPDNSFESEFEYFVWSINNKTTPWSNIEESYQILKIVDKIYEENK